MEVPALETQLDANSLGSPAPPPIITPIFTPDALPATTLPICPGLGRHRNMLDCVPLWLDFCQPTSVGEFNCRYV